MACDVHCVVERRVAGGAWEFETVLALRRNYDLFGVLAGVRRSHAPIAVPRGLPRDACAGRCGGCPDERCRRSGYGSGGCRDLGEHSFSWLTLAELRAHDWDRLLPADGVVPLRAVDVDDRTQREARAHGARVETYEEWASTPPHQPRIAWESSGDWRVLDLRPPDAIHDLEWSTAPDATVYAPGPGLRLKQIADHVEAHRLLRSAGARLLVGRPWAHDQRIAYAAYEQAARERGAPPVPRPDDGAPVFAMVSWATSARERCRQLVEWSCSRGADDGEAVRIVFGFDS